MVTANLRSIVTRTTPLWQYDYGQILEITGVELPEAYEVHFANEPHGSATTMIGGADGVLVPDIYLTTGRPIYAWIYLHTGDADGETEYTIVIPVERRASISDAPPTPVQQSVIEQAINALNTAVSEAEAARDAILSMRAEASTLPEGSDATASYNDGVMSFGIPKGDKGDQGDKGEKGDVQVAVFTVDLDSGNLVCTPTDGQDFEFTLNNGMLEVTV